MGESCPMEMVPVSSNPKRIAVISDQEKEKMDLTGRAKNYAIKDRVVVFQFQVG